MYPFENAPEFIRKLAKRVQAFNFETYHVFSSTMLNYLYDICIPSVTDGKPADEFEYSLKYIEFVKKKLERKLSSRDEIDNWLVYFVYECDCDLKRFAAKINGIKVEPKNLEQLKKFIVGKYEF